jgi:glycerol-3-phosphate dehydrogenase
LRSAPHIIWPLRFVLPHHKNLRPWWLIRMGLFIYDHLGGRHLLEGSKGHFLPGTRKGQPLKPEFKRGFSYSDCWVEDTRLVVLAARDAAEKGADIMTRTECTGLTRHPKQDCWVATLYDHLTEEKHKIHARMIVNAAGPWVGKTLELADNAPVKYKIRWVKGSHIIVPRLYQGDHAYILQNDDGRVVFVIPYEKKYSLIGTTDIDYHGDLEEVRIEIEEVDYLAAAVNRYFRSKVKAEDVLWTYSGVRPLVDDGHGKASDVTRDYILDLEDVGGLPVLSVYGGKITTFRKLSEQVGEKAVAVLGKGGPAWTKDAPLPGAEGSGANFATFVKTLKREYSWLPEALSLRLARAYGARARDILRGAKRLSDLGDYAGDHVYEAEIRYLVDYEWALTVEDILWRRSKLGIHISADTLKNLKKMLKKILKETQSS